MKKTIGLLIIPILVVLYSLSGCLFDDTAKANMLINKINLAIQDSDNIENNQITPLKDLIDKTEGSKDGAAKSLVCVQKILNKVNLQYKLMDKAKNDVSNISNLSVSDDLKTYAGLTKKCLLADIKSLNISRQLYFELQKMYKSIINNNLTQEEYEKINKKVQSLTLQAQETANNQDKLQINRDKYYQQNLKK